MQIFLALIPIIYNHLLYFIVCPLSQITILLMFPTSSYPGFLSSPDFPHPHCYSSIQPYNLHTIQNEHPYVLHLPHTRACFLDPNHTFPSALQFSTRFCIQYDLSAAFTVFDNKPNEYTIKIYCTESDKNKICEYINSTGVLYQEV